MPALLTLLITAYSLGFAVLLVSFLVLGKPEPRVRRHPAYAALLLARLATFGVFLALTWLWLDPSEALFVLMSLHVLKVAVVVLGPVVLTILFTARLVSEAGAVKFGKQPAI